MATESRAAVDGTLGLMEFGSIAAGVQCGDLVSKAADVRLLRCQPICPGKFLLIFSGATGPVRTALQAGEQSAGKALIESICLTRIHPAVADCLIRRPRGGLQRSLAVLEYRTAAMAIRGADAAVKRAQVTLCRLDTGFGIGGKGVVWLDGALGDVREAAAAAAGLPHLIQHVVIPKPSPQLLRHLK